MFRSISNGKSKKATLKTAVAILAVLFLAIPGMGLLSIDSSQAGDNNRWRNPNLCSKTAKDAFKAGWNEIKDDYWIAVGNCNNVSDTEDRAECMEDAKAEFAEAKELTWDQREARLELCEELGEAAYNPELDPNDFLMPHEYTGTNANRYFPLVPGSVRVYYAYEGDDLTERITVTVTHEFKTIEYPEESEVYFDCIVVNDVVEECEDGNLDDCSVIEDTDDWYIQHSETGDVLYMGEIARDFELDLDGNKELVEIEGSWKAGRDSDKPGVLMYGDPDPENEDQQNPYRQEFSLGNAEDIGEVISRGEETVTVPYEGVTTFNEDVLQTKDSTPIEPDVFEYKYYAPVIGMIKEENPDTGERVVLISKD